jgi:hypothetical protein
LLFDFGLWTLDIGLWTLNYFNYFTEIEDAFVRRRGKHLLVSSLDWTLIETWKELGVPLHIALRGIEKAFDSWESKPRKRSVKSLLYCQEEVEAQFAEWREARVGAAEPQADGNQNGGAENSDGLPFSRQAILEHLQRGKSSLLATRKAHSLRTEASDDDFSDVLERVARLLGEVEQDFSASARPDAQQLEQSLSGLERMLSDAIRLAAGADEIARVEKEVKEQLKPYRKQMEAAVYQQTFANLLLKRLREQFGVPRLSLFYL